MSSNIFCIMGKSGTGKDTIAKRLLEDSTLELHSLVPYTTRPKRPGETEGVEYHFTTNEEFEALLKAGKVIEYREYPHYVDGNVIYYTVNDIEDGKNYLLITTPEAYAIIKHFCDEKKIGCYDLYIYVDPVERLRRCFNRELQSNGDKYKELVRRFLADEDDYVDEKLHEYGITRHFKNEDVERLLKTMKAYFKVQYLCGSYDVEETEKFAS